MALAGGRYDGGTHAFPGQQSMAREAVRLSKEEEPHFRSRFDRDGSRTFRVGFDRDGARLKRLIEEQDQRYAIIIDFFSIIAMDSPNLARVMQARGVMPTHPPVIPPEQADVVAQELRRDLDINDFDIDP
ncbi:unnamed protein product [Cochlearia groenlandica]